MLDLAFGDIGSFFDGPMRGFASVQTLLLPSGGGSQRKPNIELQPALLGAGFLRMLWFSRQIIICEGMCDLPRLPGKFEFGTTSHDRGMS